MITKYCQNLIKLELDFQRYIVQDFDDAFVSMKKLKSIKMTNCHSIMWGSMMFDDYSLKCDDDNADDGIDLLQSLPDDIEEVTLSSCERMMPMDLFFQSAGVKFNLLHSLTLSRWNINDNVMNIITKKISLTHLSLSQCNLSIKKQPVLSKLINLEYLNFVNIDGNVNSDFITSIINDCKTLKHLNINGCKELSIEAVNHLDNLKNIEELLMNGPSTFHTNIVDDSVLDKLNNLKIFECSNHPEITDIGIMGIIKRSPNLKRLALWETNVTYEIINFSSVVAKERKKNLLVIVSPWVLDNFDDDNNNCHDYLSIKIYDKEEDEEIPQWMNETTYKKIYQII